MKRCPECRRDYHDDSLLYCLDDGSELLEGPSSGGEQPTAILDGLPRDAPTRTQIHTITGAEDVRRGSLSGEAPGNKRGVDKRLPALVGLLGIVVIVGFAGYRYFNLAGSEQISSIAFCRS